MQENTAISTQWRVPLLLGILLPIAAVVLDPLVFKGVGIVSDWVGTGYTLVAIGVASMAYWLLRRSAHPSLAGVFCVCGFMSGVIGVLLLPFSVLGVALWGIGLLGFIPFGTAYVFGRGAMDVWRQSSGTQHRALKLSLAVVAVVLVLFASQKTVDLIIDRATLVFSRESGHISTAERMLMIGASPFGLQKHAVATWRMEKDPVRARLIAVRYEALYGTRIEHDEIAFFD